MKLRSISYSAIGYFIALFLGYIVGGYLLAAYNVNLWILIGTYLVTLRLAQTGISSISLAIAWISICIWGAVLVWSKPFILGAISAQIVALLLLLSWMLAIIMFFLLAFARIKICKLGFNKCQSMYGLIMLVWGAMTLGWYLYQWTNTQ